MKSFFEHLAKKIEPAVGGQVCFTARLFGGNVFHFHLPKAWPVDGMRRSLFNECDGQESGAGRAWHIYGACLTRQALAELTAPFNRNAFGLLSQPGVTGTPAELGPFAFYDSQYGCLRAYDFERQVAYIVHAPDHQFFEWEVFSPFKEFWHYWTLYRGGLMLHSAVICKDDRALVLLGAGGAGKSTTTLTCVACGMRTAGDDFNVLLIDDRGIFAYPLFTSLKMKGDNPFSAQLPQLKTWQQQSYANCEKTIYFPRVDDTIWQQKAAQVYGLLMPIFASSLSTRSQAPKEIQALTASGVSSVLHHPYMSQLFLTRLRYLHAHLPCHQLILGSDIVENAGRVEILFQNQAENRYANS